MLVLRPPLLWSRAKWPTSPHFRHFFPRRRRFPSSLSIDGRSRRSAAMSFPRSAGVIAATVGVQSMTSPTGVAGVKACEVFGLLSLRKVVSRDLASLICLSIIRIKVQNSSYPSGSLYPIKRSMMFLRSPFFKGLILNLLS